MKDKKNKLAEYLQNKIKEKNISMHEVYKRLDTVNADNNESLSYPAITMIFNGKRKKPQYETLKLLSKALGEPYSDLLRAAGYINEHDLEEVNSMLRSMLSPMFDNDVVDVLSDETMLEILESIMETKGQNRKELLRGLRTYSRGFVSESILYSKKNFLVKSYVYLSIQKDV